MPVWQNGDNVRVISQPKELNADVYGRPYGQWHGPRVVFAQHASDPVVWWDLELLYKEPDWLTEPRGYDVNPAVTWNYLTTFLQVAMDLPSSTQTPDGHGHSYGTEIISAWRQVLAGADSPVLHPAAGNVSDAEITRRLR